MHQKSVLFITTEFFRVKFRPTVCNSCHNMLMFVNLNNIAILNIYSVDYCCIINGTKNIEVINLLKNADLS